MKIEAPASSRRLCTARHRRGLTVALAALAVLFATAANAFAAVYQWRVDADGDWTNPANWIVVFGSTKQPDGLLPSPRHRDDDLRHDGGGRRGRTVA